MEGELYGLLAALMLTLDEHEEVHINDLRDDGRKPGESRKVSANRVYRGLQQLKALGYAAPRGAYWIALAKGRRAARRWHERKLQEASVLKAQGGDRGG